MLASIAAYHHRGLAALVLDRPARLQSDALYRRPVRRELAHAFTSDIGHGIFDGAWLVQNFENLNPANTLWKKPYNLFSKTDTEAAHYLEFERWWGGHVNLTAAEMQFIVDELFVGNKLAAGQVKSSTGTAINLRNIRSPIVVFCSKGDNITPPQQALGWILDFYDDVDEIRSYGQTIVYSVHESVGHLGIFVSGGVAAQGARRVRKQYRPDRGAAARPLRSDLRSEIGRHDQSRPRARRVDHALRGKDARRHSRARRQRRSGRSPICDRCPAVGSQYRAVWSHSHSRAERSCWPLRQFCAQASLPMGRRCES